MIKENWRTIDGYETYMVSNLGRIKSFHPRYGTTNPRILKPGDRGRGYQVVSLCKDKKSSQFAVHRLVLFAFVGPPPDGMERRHSNADKENNRLSNLSWATKTENQRDRVKHGTHLRGERHRLAKLNEDKVRKMRRLRKSGLTYVAIGKQFGINRGIARAACVGITWRHVDD